MVDTDLHTEARLPGLRGGPSREPITNPLLCAFIVTMRGIQKVSAIKEPEMKIQPNGVQNRDVTIAENRATLNHSAICYPNIPQNKKLEGNVAVICPDNQSENVENYLPLNTELHCAMVDASGVNRDGKLSFEIATVCGNKCKMLRDTGCNTVAVNRSLIPKESLAGRSVNVRTFCCANRTFPTGVVDLQSDYFTGLVEACVLDNPVADVILGNITGMCDQSIDGIGKLNFACPVQTRARAKDVSEAKSNCDTEENKSTSDVHMFDRFSDFAQRQREDATLKAWFDKVGKGWYLLCDC